MKAAGSMPRERRQWRNRRDPPRRANDWKKNGQWNRPESKVHSQQNKAKTPRTAGSYQMYLGHGLEEPEEVIGFTECRLGTAPHTMIGSLTMKTVTQPTRPEPTLETSQEAEPEKMTDDGKSMDKAVPQSLVLFRTTPSSQSEEP